MIQKILVSEINPAQLAWCGSGAVRHAVCRIGTCGTRFFNSAFNRRFLFGWIRNFMILVVLRYQSRLIGPKFYFLETVFPNLARYGWLLTWKLVFSTVRLLFHRFFDSGWLNHDLFLSLWNQLYSRIFIEKMP